MKTKVLLIEDNPEVRENTAEILELANYHVLTAENGKEGVKLAKQELPDIIICDIMMPIMDGYEVLYMLSKDENTSLIPFIFLTAKADATDMRRGMTMGADDYVTKPFEEMDLLKAIETRLQKSNALKQQFTNEAESVNSFLELTGGMDTLEKMSLDSSGLSLKKREYVYREGDHVNYLIYLKKGKVRTFNINEDGKEYTTALYSPGDFLGYRSLIEGREHVNSAVVMEDAEIYRIPKDTFNDLIFNNREIAQAFIKLLTGNLLEKEQELLHLAYNSVRKRVAEALMKLYDKFKSEQQTTFEIRISRDDLASMVGTSTESVIRVLSSFKEDELVEMKGSEIRILEPEKLNRMHN